MTTQKNDLFSLKERVILVTGGAGSGYGGQIVRAIAHAGGKVIMTSRDPEKAHRKEKEYQGMGLDVHAEKLDLESEQSILSCVKSIFEKHGRIDVLFNNACINHLEAFEKVKLEDWNRVLQVNITGSMLMARAIAPSMLKAGKGSIINLSSIYGVVSPDQGIYGNSGLNSPLVYGLTKAALLQMTRHWATYWAPKIRVNAITPGGLFNNQDPEFVKNYVNKTPMGRMGQDHDLDGAAVYLASDASSWVTGQNIVVDGGFTIW